jgi:hypothetical protein
LAFFIDREHHRVLGRIDVKADNVLQFLGKLRIVRSSDSLKAGCAGGRVDEPFQLDIERKARLHLHVTPAQLRVIVTIRPATPARRHALA